MERFKILSKTLSPLCCHFDKILLIIRFKSSFTFVSVIYFSLVFILVSATARARSPTSHDTQPGCLRAGSYSHISHDFQIQSPQVCPSPVLGIYSKDSGIGTIRSYFCACLAHPGDYLPLHLRPAVYPLAIHRTNCRLRKAYSEWFASWLHIDLTAV